MMIDQHSINTLEFPKVVSKIAGQCRTPFGKEEVNRRQPLYDRPEIERRLTEVTQMKEIISFGRAFPLYRLDDCRELLDESQVEGMFLDPKEILTVSELVEVSMAIHEYDKEGRENFPAITDYLVRMRAFPELKKEIHRVLDENAEIRDNASSKLKNTRLDLNENKRRIMSRLERILSGQQKQAGWQDDVVTMRSGRYVIPVPTSQYRTGSGILHDRSQSGATLYVEPTETVELNNRINLLMQEERLEMDRILRALTAEIASRSSALLENVRLIGKLDAIYACAQFSRRVKGNQPTIKEAPEFGLIDARHPLLIVQMDDFERVVPITIGLDEARQAVLITGPNTGGKTISLKTVGLSLLMAQSGLHISAGEKSSVGIFKNLFADIGDEQSIELSLSTFSSHMKNIIHGLSGASEETLLLFDEIGAGTDPKEGSALAEAILLYGLQTGSKILATTHYSQLKTLATEYPAIENAALEFDRRTLAPTYRLHLGIPGSSYAVEIARRLGLPQSVCQQASTLVGSGERSLNTLIASLETELTKLKKDSAELDDRLTKARELEKRYQSQIDQLKTDVATERRKALEETELFLDQTRKEIEKLVAEIRQTQASKETVRKFHRAQKGKQEKLKALQLSAEQSADDGAVFHVGDSVEILTLRRTGEIEQLLGNDRAKVKVGKVLTTVELRNLRKVSQSPQLKHPRKAGVISVQQSERPEIHLRGMTVEEALESLEKFLDRAVVAGFSQVYVVHGKGTGTLRRTLTNYLKGHPEVESLRLGNWNEGGAGVTIAKLKD
jgi:DNA mismatch repair protein MutS2